MAFSMELTYFITYMRTQLNLLLKNILRFSDFIFNKINQFFYFLYKNLIANFSNFLIGIVFLIILVFYQAIVEILNFEILGKQFNLGDGLSALFSLGFEATWNLLISFIRSYSPDGPVGLAFEIITESIALVLFLIGYAVVLLIYILKLLWFLINEFGFYNILVILSWSYLIGLYTFLYKTISSFLESRSNKNELLELDDAPHNNQDN